ncbi:type II toxin-antitoxin system CcdA family antitoxin [Pelagerythrobacter sp.]|uniref:type II toxin-antitoxin system CcdA family antitoxin n=1 Tax=Pelagerythrobacter sp. TaxID=2800702 RepID=UPI0035B155D4
MNAHTRGSLRRATNVSLDQSLVEAARELDINLSRACEEGLAREVKTTREARWREENAEAIQAWNDHVAEHGLPLAKYRKF